MKQDVRNNINRVNSSFVVRLLRRTDKIFNRLAAEKKKTVFSVCLIALMVFMWVRVLDKKTPEAAEATLEQSPALASQEAAGDDTSKSSPELKVTFIELPKVAGRNDSIARDFFVSDDWWKLIVSGEGEK